MRVFEYPSKDERRRLTERPVIESAQLSQAVSAVVERVRRDGDSALRAYAREFDGLDLTDIEVSAQEFEAASSAVSDQLKAAIAAASENIKRFHTHSASAIDSSPIETTPGVFCWRRSLPIEKVGIYIPAGTAPLFSTVLMLAIPAKLAGCREVIMCSPAGSDGTVSPATLYAARACGVDRVFKVGGAQAIAAMASGTETVPAVYKIFGPGNQYVTEAKLQVMKFATAIDMPAGPSEVVVLADDTAVPAFVAADLLSQAEHGKDSQVMLVSTSRAIIDASLAELEKQLEDLPRCETARVALDASAAVLVDSIDKALALINEYAPEHLIIAAADAEAIGERITTAGSVFIGNYACESFGDYASGTNHTLPTNGAARAFSGVSVESFMRSITFQRINREGVLSLGAVVETMAEAEGLEAHRRAVAVRSQEVSS